MFVLTLCQRPFPSLAVDKKKLNSYHLSLYRILWACKFKQFYLFFFYV